MMRQPLRVRLANFVNYRSFGPAMNTSVSDETIRAAKILVVDDIEANVELAARLLRKQGYTSVTGTTDPNEGLALAHSESFDLLLLDMRMPRLDGYEFMRRL